MDFTWLVLKYPASVRRMSAIVSRSSIELPGDPDRDVAHGHVLQVTRQDTDTRHARRNPP
jgi:hypothetical protein